MDHESSVSVWIERLKAGDEAAAQQLWQKFFVRLLGLAQRKLGTAERRVNDEEDVVLSVFETVFRRAKEGRFPQLEDRHDLWKLLVTVTECKALNQMRAARQKRGGGRVRGDSVFTSNPGSSSSGGGQQIESLEPTPEFAALMAEAVEGLLSQLDEDQRTIALRKLEGYSNEEIAEQIGRSVPTVERRLRLIRAVWQAAE